MRRLTYGPLLIAGLALALWADVRVREHSGVPWISAALIAVFTVAAQRELVTIVGRGRVTLPRGLLSITAVAYFVARSVTVAQAPGSLSYVTLLTAAVIAVLLTGAVVCMRPVEQSIERLGGTLLAFLLVLAMGHALDVIWRFGIGALGALAFTAKLGDIGGYLVGRSIGRRKIAPAVSPGKTLEGTLGGYLFSLAGAVLLFPWFVGDRWSVPALLGIGLAVNTAGFLGDLVESALKRAANVKDSGRWVPEFGGALDMVDSLVLALPLGHALLVLLERLPPV